MRELKFQAYVVKAQLSGYMGIGEPGIDEYEEMIDVETIIFSDGEVDLVADREGNEYPMHDGSIKAIREFTGLRDKNGKEIYEGDIMHSDNFSKMVISFVGGCFVGKSTIKVQALNWKPSSLVGLNMLRYEVIGNIHENPELLREESQ